MKIRHFLIPLSILLTHGLHAANPVAEAGAEIAVSDFDEDGFVTQLFDGGASTDTDNDIVSWDWSWAGGGSATGEVVEVVLPADNTPFTVTLTVTDDLGNMDTDTLEVGVYERSFALYRDINDSSWIDVGSGLEASLAGERLLVNPAIPAIFDFTAGSWVEDEAFSYSSRRLNFLLDEDTVFSTSITRWSSDPAVSRWDGSSWVVSQITLDVPGPGQSTFNNKRTVGASIDTVVYTDYEDDNVVSNGGRVFVYDWVGDELLFNTELSPPAGHVENGRFGREVVVDGDIIVVEDSLDYHIYRRTAGVWNYETSVFADLSVAVSPSTTFFDINNGVLVGRSGNSTNFVVFEKVGGVWESTLIPAPFNSSQIHFEVDSDGLSFALSNGTNYYVYQRDPAATSWSTATITENQLFVDDLQNIGTAIRVVDFEEGRVVIRDGVTGRIRVIDTDTAVFGVNVEPVADAGANISSTSFDGAPVRVFLNGGGSEDVNDLDAVTAEWSWAGGFETGLSSFANLEVDVLSIELKLTDGEGAISRDTILVDIESPPVINAGIDRIVADTDGDQTILLNVDGSLVSSDNPIVSWNWRWPGGAFSGQTGVIPIGAAANGKDVTLEVVDSAGLASSATFSFRLLESNPTPEIILPVDGSPNDRFATSVSIDDGTAMVGSWLRQVDGAIRGGTYFLEEVNGAWQQLVQDFTTGFDFTLGSGFRVIIDGDIAFSIGDRTTMQVLERIGDDWTFVESIAFGPTAIAYQNGELFLGQGGEVDIYNVVEGSWMVIQELQSPDFEAYGGIGFNVAVNGDILATGSGVVGYVNTGSIQIFERGPTSWEHAASFQSEITERPYNFEFDTYAASIVVTEDEVLVGAPLTYDSSPFGTGVIYRYKKVGGTWQENGFIQPTVDGGAPNADYFGFGSSMAYKNGVLTVGCRGAPEDGVGAVFTFTRSGNDWINTGLLTMTPTIDPFYDTSGSFAWRTLGLDHDGNDLIVGAEKGRNESGQQTGKAYIYRDYAPLNPNANYEPVANAGVDITKTDTIERSEVDPFPIAEPLGSEPVMLNGSASTDAENDIVSYEWTWASGSASGISPTARFPVGTTTVTLTVTDGFGIVNSDTVDVTVSLAQADPVALPDVSGNSLTVDLPVSGALWRLSSEFLWHADGATIDNVEVGETYQIEIIGFPGSTQTISTFITTDSATTTATLNVTLPIQPTQTGTLRFPETEQGFSWRLAGESTWRNVTDNGDTVEDVLSFTVPRGPLRIEFKPVLGYSTPQTRIINVGALSILLNWGEYIRINNFDSSKTFDLADLSTDPNLETPPYQYIGKIRTPLGRGSGTAVADGVVLTAAHLFFDFNGLQWSDVQWFPRQLQGTFQAAPVLPRGILYRTSYAKLVAPDSVEGEVANLPEDDQEVDFAVLYFGTSWEGGSANFLQSTAEKNWITGTESKHAVGYPQRSQSYPDKGKIFEKQFSSALTPLDSGSLPLLYETSEVFGDGGASGSALFVQPEGGTQFYPAAVLLAGQGRGVYHIIDSDVTRMIKDGQDAASGNDDVLDNNSSLVTYESLGGITAIGVDISPPGVLSNARWSVTPNAGTGFANLSEAQAVPVNPAWDSITISFTAVSGYATPAPIFLDLDPNLISPTLTPGVTNEATAVYEPLSGFDDWLQDNAIADPFDDSDGDQRSALLEYATDGQPTVVDFLEVVRVVPTPSGDKAQYEVYVSSAADAILYEVKAVSSLSDISDPGQVELLATFTRADGPGYQTVTDTKTFSEASSRFVWVEITHDRDLSTE